MRNISRFLILGIFLILTGCVSYYGIIKESKPSGDLRTYDVIHVGWLDLGEDRWKEYGYEEKDKEAWVTTIDHMNRKALPDYLKEAIPNKKVSVADSKNTALPKEGLVIKFTDVNYVQRTSTAAKVMFGSFAGSDTLDLTVHFINGKTQEELYTVETSIYSKSAFDAAGWGFDGRINNCVYNLAYFIQEKTQ